MAHDPSSPRIESQGHRKSQRSGSSMYGRGNAIVRSVWLQSLIEDSFSIFFIFIPNIYASSEKNENLSLLMPLHCNPWILWDVVFPESNWHCVELSGHRYGSTLVPFSAEDKDAMKYKTEKCFKMLGFTKAENVCTCNTPSSLTLILSFAYAFVLNSGFKRKLVIVASFK